MSNYSLLSSQRQTAYIPTNMNPTLAPKSGSGSESAFFTPHTASYPAASAPPSDPPQGYASTIVNPVTSKSSAPANTAGSSASVRCASAPVKHSLRIGTRRMPIIRPMRHTRRNGKQIAGLNVRGEHAVLRGRPVDVLVGVVRGAPADSDRAGQHDLHFVGGWVVVGLLVVTVCGHPLGSHLLCRKGSLASTSSSLMKHLCRGGGTWGSWGLGLLV